MKNYCGDVGFQTVRASFICASFVATCLLAPKARSSEFIGVAASSGATVEHSVFKLTCEVSGQGSGFLHKSGLIITAAHVAHGCTTLSIVGADGAMGSATVVARDEVRDVAVLRPDHAINATPLRIKANPTLTVGESVAIWGYPAGYSGLKPLLASGVVAGQDKCQGEIQRTVINAAINHGDSGGPIVDAQTGEVIGISDSKIIPLSPITVSAMDALGSNGSGMMYTVRTPDGSQKNVSEAQVVNQVLFDLASQVQLVVGCAVTTQDILTALENGGAQP